MNKLNKAQQNFAAGWKREYFKARKQLSQLPFWSLGERNRLEREMRITEYHYRKITGKTIKLEDNPDINLH